MNTILPARTIGILLVGLLGLLLSFLASQAIQRPLWLDEVMAMSNYPLSGLLAVFDPLPRYAQAAPPFFNLVSNLLAALDPVVGRAMLMVTILVGLMLAVLAVFPSVWTAATAIFVMVASANMIIIASEFKYYGFEMLGTALLLAWLLLKNHRNRFTFGDLGLLILCTCLGISGMVISVAALATYGLFRLRGVGSIKFDEMVKGAVFFIFIAGYYLVIQHETRIQILGSPDAYGATGLHALKGLVRAMINFGGRGMLPLTVAAAVVACLDFRNQRSRTLLLFCVLTVLAFAVLAVLGKYPAVSPRHVAWSGAVSLFLIANAVAVLGCNWLRMNGSRRAGISVLAVSVAAVALVPTYRLLNREAPYVQTDNDALVAWLRNSQVESIGLWIGGQPVVEFYEKKDPEIAKHAYFGAVNAESVPIAPEFRGPYSNALAATIESLRAKPGAWGRAGVYREYLDYFPPARSLLALAPVGRRFYILASHLDITAQKGFSKARNDALFGTLDAMGCASRTELQVRNGYILQVTCPRVGVDRAAEDAL